MPAERRTRKSACRACLVALAALALGAPPATASVPTETRTPARHAFSEDFAGPRLDARRWTHWWGLVDLRSGSAVLASKPPKRSDETFSSLVTTRQKWRDFQLDLDLGGIRQLRTGGAANTWETAWVMFRFRGLHDYYYFIVKPNGWELGKKQGSDEQIFIATGASPRLAIGEVAHLTVTAVGARITVSIDGTQVVDLTDPRPLRGGAIGLYEEDAVARFGAVRVAGLHGSPPS